MRALTKEQVYEAVSDLAGDAGMTADAYIASLLRQAEEEILQRALSRLTARRGSFPFLPEFGSRLYLLGTVAPSVRALAAERYVTEALAPETALRVEQVRLRGSELTVTLIRAGTERELRLPLGEVTA